VLPFSIRDNSSEMTWLNLILMVLLSAGLLIAFMFSGFEKENRAALIVSDLLIHQPLRPPLTSWPS
jgi:hypothetical protein